MCIFEGKLRGPGPPPNPKVLTKRQAKLKARYEKRLAKWKKMMGEHEETLTDSGEGGEPVESAERDRDGAG